MGTNQRATPEVLKGTVSPDILIIFMMSIIKSVLFVWSLIPLRFFIDALIYICLQSFNVHLANYFRIG